MKSHLLKSKSDCILEAFILLSTLNSNYIDILLSLFVFFIAIAIFAAWVWSIVDIVRSEFEGNGKIVWLLVVIFLGILGTLIYYFAGRSSKIS